MRLNKEHYILPEGNVQIAFSGGRTSAYMLHQICEANGGIPDCCKVVFANTGREMPQTLDFVKEVSDRWGIHVAWVEYKTDDWGKHSFRVTNHAHAMRKGEPLIALMKYFGFVPNRTARFCSHEGKTRTAKRYCASLGWEQWAVAVGIRADEAGRAIKSQPKERYSVWYPLLSAGVSKRDVADFWQRQPFDLGLKNVKGNASLGNCDGCFLKSEAKRAMLARDYPDRAAWWAEQERIFGGTFHVNTSWDELRRMVRDQSDWIFDAEDALCQANEGECTI